jgi:hypothetical protein
MELVISAVSPCQHEMKTDRAYVEGFVSYGTDSNVDKFFKNKIVNGFL